MTSISLFFVSGSSAHCPARGSICPRSQASLSLPKCFRRPNLILLGMQKSLSLGHMGDKDGASSCFSFYIFLFLPSSSWFLKNNSLKTPVSRFTSDFFFKNPISLKIMDLPFFSLTVKYVRGEWRGLKIFNKRRPFSKGQHMKVSSLLGMALLFHKWRH